MSSNRDKLMRLNNFEIPYVTDGLEIYVDGIENSSDGHDSSASTWFNHGFGNVDVQIANLKTTAWQDNCFHNENNSMRLTYNSLTFNSRNFTYEMVYKTTTNHDYTPLLQFASQSSSFDNWIYATGELCFRVSNDTKTSITTSSNNVMHFYQVSCSTNARFFFDGNFIKTRSMSNVNYTNKNMAIFGTCDGSRYINGNVYCVRFYNRPLTDEELAYNHAVDVERFGEE